MCVCVIKRNYCGFYFVVISQKGRKFSANCLNYRAAVTSQSTAPEQFADFQEPRKIWCARDSHPSCMVAHTRILIFVVEYVTSVYLNLHFGKKEH